MESAIQDLKWFAKRAQGILDLVPELEKVSSLKNQATELENLIPKLKDQLNDAKKVVDEEETKIDDLREGFKILSKELASKAKDMTDEAKNKADDIISKADLRAKEIVSEAENRIYEINTKLKDKQAELAKVTTEASAKESYLSNLNKQIDQLKSKFN